MGADTNFYPRPPRGGRPQGFGLCSQAGQISIHALREEGDADRLEITTHCAISIHALREEGDLSASYYYTFSKISIHALREEGDECREHAGRNQCISIHALREEGDVFFLTKISPIF